MKFFKSSKKATAPAAGAGPTEWQPGGPAPQHQVPRHHLAGNHPQHQGGLDHAPQQGGRVSCPSPLYPPSDQNAQLYAPQSGYPVHPATAYAPQDGGAGSGAGEGPYGRPANSDFGPNIVGFERARPSGRTAHMPQANIAANASVESAPKAGSKPSKAGANLRPFLLGTLFGMGVMFAFLALPLGDGLFGNGADDVGVRFDDVANTSPDTPPAQGTFLDQAIENGESAPE